MKKFKLLILLTGLLAGTSLLAQNGTVRGTLIDDEEGYELIGANVIVQELGTGVATDLDGKFSLSLAPGTYTLTFTYVSYADIVREDVEVKAGEVTIIEPIRMGTAAQMIDIIEVTAEASRKSESAMQTVQRKSLTTLDAISSETFSKIGASDAASAVMRAPAVSVEGGKYVYVRGLGDRYSKTTLNSANIPGLDPDRNSVQMDLFPTALIDNITVYKTFTPDLAGDFTGGLVDVVTKDFPDAFTFQASVNLGYTPTATFNSNYLSYQGGQLDFLGFDDGTRDFSSNILDGIPTRDDVLLSAAAANELTEDTKSLNNISEPVSSPNFLNHGLSIAFGDQKTLFGKAFGFTGSLTYSRGFSGYANGVNGRYKLTDPTASVLNEESLLDDNRYTDEVIWGAMLSGSLKLNNSNKVTLNLIRNQTGESSTRYETGTKAKDFPDDLYQERTLGYIQRSLTTGQLKGEHNFGGGKEYTIEWISSATLSDMLQPDLRFYNNFVENPQSENPNYVIKVAEDLPPTRFRRAMKEFNFDNHIDLTYKFLQWNSLTSKLKLGGFATLKDRTFKDQSYVYESELDFFDGDYSTFVNDNSVFSASNQQGIRIVNSSQDRNNYQADNMLTGGYLMTELPFTSKLKMVAGARAEYSYLTFTSKNTRLQSERGLLNKPLINQINILPSAAVIYEVIKDKMNLRASYSQTVARPTFREIAPIAFFDVVRQVLIRGNEELKVTQITNYDFRWEYFFKTGEMVSTSLFYKNFANPIELTSPAESVNKELLYKNVPNANVYGFELEAKKKLNFISPALENLTIGANFTYVISKVDIPSMTNNGTGEPDELEVIRATDPEALPTRPLFGQSPFIINTYLAYQNNVGTSATISFNMQGERLAIITGGGTPDVFEQSFPLLNAKVSQKIGNRLKVGVSAKNILNSTYREIQTYKGTDYTYRSFQRGPSFSVSLSYNLNKAE